MLAISHGFAKEDSKTILEIEVLGYSIERSLGLWSNYATLPLHTHSQFLIPRRKTVYGIWRYEPHRHLIQTYKMKKDTIEQVISRTTTRTIIDQDLSMKDHTIILSRQITVILDQVHLSQSITRTVTWSSFLKIPWRSLKFYQNLPLVIVPTWCHRLIHPLIHLSHTTSSMMSSMRQLTPFKVYLDHHSMKRQCVIPKVVTSQSQDLRISHTSWLYSPFPSSHSLLIRLHRIRAPGISLPLDYFHHFSFYISFSIQYSSSWFIVYSFLSFSRIFSFFLTHSVFISIKIEDQSSLPF